MRKSHRIASFLTLKNQRWRKSCRIAAFFNVVKIKNWGSLTECFVQSCRQVDWETTTLLNTTQLQYFFRPTPSWLPPGRSTRSIACCKLDCKSELPHIHGRPLIERPTKVNCSRPEDRNEVTTKKPNTNQKQTHQTKQTKTPRQNMTSKSPVGDISVVTLIRADTTLDHSQKGREGIHTTQLQAEIH